METYRYKALTEQGADTAGIIEATSFDDAIESLLARGLREIQVFQLQPDGAELDGAELGGAEPRLAPVSLSSQEAVVLSQQVAHVSAAELPLAAGLRAAAEETAQSRVAVALIWLADQVDQGRSLEEALTNSGPLLPPYIAGLILAAARTGSLGEALFELVELQQKTYSLRREITSGYMYPLIVVALAAIIVISVGYYVTGMMQSMMYDFELELPLATRVLFWWRSTGTWVVGGLALALLCVATMYRLLGGPVRWRRLLSTVPLFGALWHWTGVAEWSGLLSVLLRHHVPLPEALRWAGRGTRDAHVGHLSQRLADGVSRGRSLSQMMYTCHQMPASIIPMVQWGEQSGDLPDAFRVGQEMFEKRATMRAMMLQAVIPPLLFLAVGSTIMFMVGAQFIPMINLISQLS